MENQNEESMNQCICIENYTYFTEHEIYDYEIIRDPRVMSYKYPFPYFIHIINNRIVESKDYDKYFVDLEEHRNKQLDKIV